MRVLMGRSGKVPKVAAPASRAGLNTARFTWMTLRGRVMKVSSEQGMLDFLNSGSFSGEQVAAGPDFRMDSFDNPPGKAGIKEYLPDRIKAEVDSPAAGVVVHASGYYPQWKAKLDGKPAKIYCVNVYSMGVMVPAGIHELEFYYDKTGIYIGFMIAAAAFIFYGLMLYNSLKARANGQ